MGHIPPGIETYGFTALGSLLDHPLSDSVASVPCEHWLGIQVVTAL